MVLPPKQPIGRTHMGYALLFLRVVGSDDESSMKIRNLEAPLGGAT